MRTPEYSSQFKRDVRRAQKRGKDVAKLKELLSLLIEDTPLPTRYKDHPLRNNWAGYRDAHIEPDWLQIYTYVNNAGVRLNAPGRTPICSTRESCRLLLSFSNHLRVNLLHMSQRIVLFAAAFSLAAFSSHAQTAPQYPNYPSETPATLQQPTYAGEGMDYERREVMIAMRDGVKLHTVILVPKAAKHEGILLTRTPYSATATTTNALSIHLGSTLYGYDNALETIVGGGYIRVVQDIRGKYGSEGDYVMNRPNHGPLNPTPVDETTDTYDTIDWLVKNVPESNGKVGILGISYDGFTALIPISHPHPALKVAVPMNPMVDGWRGDDWFHNGAFREQNMSYIYEQAGSRGNDYHWLNTYFDDYDFYMNAGSAGELGKRRGLEQIGFWKKVIEHPAYDSFWSDQAVDKVVAAEPLTVPTMLVQSLWDQEDIYGAIATYKALEPKDTHNDKLFLVIGPWHHGQEIEEASSLGAVKFHSDTGLYFREQILAPFLAHYLKDDPPPLKTAPVTAYETGTNTWERLDSWPSGCAHGCEPKATPMYLQAGSKLGFKVPSGSEEFDEFVSDPAKPVPFRTRPNQPMGYTPNLSWVRWLVDDQREFSGRTDVLTYTSEVLTSPLKISGEPIANLVASTTGSDADWGGQADRCLSGRGCWGCGDGRVSACGVDGHLPRAISRESGGG